MPLLAEYIWIDGAEPVNKLRSKTRVLADGDRAAPPDWGFDGSSTNQSEGSSSDLILKPVRVYKDPVRDPERDILVLCEVLNANGGPHVGNTRANLVKLLELGAINEASWFGFEQEYTLFKGRVPLGWPQDRGVMPPQGPYYCGVGADEVFGRDLVEDHLAACIKAELLIYGANAEVMPGQWEFQIGHRPGVDEDGIAGPLQVSDDLWVARWLLYRLGEKYNISATLDPKPMSGDWNGSGCHTNFSTARTRSPEKGTVEIARIIKAFERKHAEHIAVYGSGNELRLTGKHETCDINTFKAGNLDRGASIRIPESVAKKGYGYLEDRRPAGNIDPYVVCDRMLRTICE